MDENGCIAGNKRCRGHTFNTGRAQRQWCAQSSNRRRGCHDDPRCPPFVGNVCVLIGQPLLQICKRLLPPRIGAAAGLNVESNCIIRHVEMKFSLYYSGGDVVLGAGRTCLGDEICRDGRGGITLN